MDSSRRFVLSSTGLLALSLSSGAVAETITIATVENGDMVRMQELSERFTEENPDIELEWVVFDENTLRQRVTTDIATNGGRFDVVTIGTYEAAIWAERDWLASLDDLPGDYDIDDLLPSIRAGLSHEGTLYAAPFYGESSFTMYRTDLFEQAGLEMPDEPTWDFVKEAAATLTDRENGVAGICLRGKPGWGENMALVTAMANSYGARWFDEEWQPEFGGDAWNSVLGDYAEMLTENGPEDAASLGFQENLTRFQEGGCAIWVDATSAGQFVIGEESSVADSVGFAMAPDTGLGKKANWLWSWALAIPNETDSEGLGEEVRGLGGRRRDYIELVAESEGWASVPPGARASLYENPEYQEVPFAAMTLASIEAADPAEPTVEAVPYNGIQFVAIPEFQSIGTAVGQRFAKALDGSITGEEARADAQWVTEKVIERTDRLGK